MKTELSFVNTDRMHAAAVRQLTNQRAAYDEAVTLWQAADLGRERVIPSAIQLTAYLMCQLVKAKAALNAAGNHITRHSVLLNKGDFVRRLERAQ